MKLVLGRLDNELVGRLIGRDGRNVRLIEELTGVEFEFNGINGELIAIIGDTKESIDFAKRLVTKLVKDGHININAIRQTFDDLVRNL